MNKYKYYNLRKKLKFLAKTWEYTYYGLKYKFYDNLNEIGTVDFALTFGPHNDRENANNNKNYIHS